MTVVDVNTGKFTGSGGNLEETVTKNNLEAAEEIVRQLRLRDIGGIIVVDFIDMVLESNRDLVLRRLVECLGRDRTRHQVAEVTSLGLVQMTRKRIGTGLLEAFSENCEHCQGRGIVIHDRRSSRARGTTATVAAVAATAVGVASGEGGNGGGNDNGGGAPSPKDVAAKARAENAERARRADDAGDDRDRRRPARRRSATDASPQERGSQSDGRRAAGRAAGRGPQHRPAVATSSATTVDGLRLLARRARAARPRDADGAARTAGGDGRRAAGAPPTGRAGGAVRPAAGARRPPRTHRQPEAPQPSPRPSHARGHGDEPRSSRRPSRAASPSRRPSPRGIRARPSRSQRHPRWSPGAVVAAPAGRPARRRRRQRTHLRRRRHGVGADPGRGPAACRLGRPADDGLVEPGTAGIEPGPTDRRRGGDPADALPSCTSRSRRRARASADRPTSPRGSCPRNCGRIHSRAWAASFRRIAAD